MIVWVWALALALVVGNAPGATADGALTATLDRGVLTVVGCRGAVMLGGGNRWIWIGDAGDTPFVYRPQPPIDVAYRPRFGMQVGCVTTGQTARVAGRYQIVLSVVSTPQR